MCTMRNRAVKSELSHGHLMVQNTENDSKILKSEALCTETCKLSLEAMHMGAKAQTTPNLPGACADVDMGTGTRWHVVVVFFVLLLFVLFFVCQGAQQTCIPPQLSWCNFCSRIILIMSPRVKFEEGCSNQNFSRLSGTPHRQPIDQIHLYTYTLGPENNIRHGTWER